MRNSLSISNFLEKIRLSLSKDFDDPSYCSNGNSNKKILTKEEFEKMQINYSNTKVYISKCKKNIGEIPLNESSPGTYTKEMFLRMLYFFFVNTEKGTKIKIQLANNLSESLNGGLDEGFMNYEEQKNFIYSLIDDYFGDYKRKNDIEIVDFATEYYDLMGLYKDINWIENLPKNHNEKPILNDNSNSKDYFLYLSWVASNSRDFADWILGCIPKDLTKNNENWQYPNYLNEPGFYYTIAEIATRTEDYIKGIINHLGADRQREYYDVRVLGSMGIKKIEGTPFINKQRIFKILDKQRIFFLTKDKIDEFNKKQKIRDDYSNGDLFIKIKKFLLSDDFNELKNYIDSFDENKSFGVEEQKKIEKIISNIQKKYKKSDILENLIFSSIKHILTDVTKIDLSLLDSYIEHVDAKLNNPKEKPFNGVYFESEDSIYDRINKGNPIVKTRRYFNNAIMGLVTLSVVGTGGFWLGKSYLENKEEMRMGKILDDFLTGKSLSGLKDKNGNPLKIEDKREIYKKIYSNIIDNFAIRYNFEMNEFNQKIIPSILFSEIANNSEIFEIVKLSKEQFGQKITEFVDNFVQKNKTFLEIQNIDSAPYKKLKHFEQAFIDTINFDGVGAEKIIEDYFHSGLIDFTNDYKNYNSNHLFITTNGEFGNIMYFHKKKGDIILKDLDNNEYIIDENSSGLVYMYKPDFHSSKVTSGKTIAYDYFWQTRSPILNIIFNILKTNSVIDENLLKERIIKFYINNEKDFEGKYKDLSEKERIIKISDEIRELLKTIKTIKKICPAN